MISIGISTFLWTSPFTTRNLDLIKKAKTMGFDLVEIPIEDEHDIDYTKVKETFERENLKSSISTVMSAKRDLSHEDKEKQREGISYLNHCIDAAEKIGAPTVVGPLYAAVGRLWQATSEQRNRELERCAKNLKIVAKRAEDKGIMLAIEPLNRFESSFINITEQAIQLMGLVDSPNLKIMMDTFHANIEEKSIVKAIELAGNNLIHIHANENDRGTPGKGHVPWIEMAASLKKYNYNGALVIETFSTIVKKMAKSAAIWRELAPSQDMLAEEGLAYLRRVFKSTTTTKGGGLKMNGL
jgi:D-psicose/D-tagatose/L-ribulose 3-epimerase